MYIMTPNLILVQKDGRVHLRFDTTFTHFTSTPRIVSKVYVSWASNKTQPPKLYLKTYALLSIDELETLFLHTYIHPPSFVVQGTFLI